MPGAGALRLEPAAVHGGYWEGGEQILLPPGAPIPVLGATAPPNTLSAWEIEGMGGQEAAEEVGQVELVELVEQVEQMEQTEVMEVQERSELEVSQVNVVIYKFRNFTEQCRHLTSEDMHLSPDLEHTGYVPPDT